MPSVTCASRGRGFIGSSLLRRRSGQAGTELRGFGPVEGQVNRLKLIKRSMYGRAKFDLLRQRVLHAA